MTHDDHPAAAPALAFTGATAILRVAGLDASLGYYADALGFRVAWRTPDFACVERGEARLMLCEGGQGAAGTWVYVSVSDADAAHEELCSRGARVRHPPTNYPWGARELQVTDLDGHVLRLGSDATPGEPFGDWLDADGRRWRPVSDDGWQLVPEP